MAYRDWSEEQREYFEQQGYQEIYENIPSVPYLDEDQDEAARELFAAGWLTFGEYSKEELDSIRNDFYNMVYVGPELFRALGYWANYRALYDEVDAG